MSRKRQFFAGVFWQRAVFFVLCFVWFVLYLLLSKRGTVTPHHDRYLYLIKDDGLAGVGSGSVGVYDACKGFDIDE